MKKIIAVGLIVATLAAGTFAVNAADTDTFPSERGYGHMMERNDRTRSDRTNRKIDLTNEEEIEWRNERHEERINQALENETITEEEAIEFRAHFDEMNKRHEENGFRGRNCHDSKDGRQNGHGMRRNGMMGRNSRNGNGMMRGNRR